MLNTYSEPGSAGFPQRTTREGWAGWDGVLNAAANMPDVILHY
jgi:hypothetical protein